LVGDGTDAGAQPRALPLVDRCAEQLDRSVDRDALVRRAFGSCYGRRPRPALSKGASVAPRDRASSTISSRSSARSRYTPPGLACARAHSTIYFCLLDLAGLLAIAQLARGARDRVGDRPLRRGTSPRAERLERPLG